LPKIGEPCTNDIIRPLNTRNIDNGVFVSCSRNRLLGEYYAQGISLGSIIINPCCRQCIGGGYIEQYKELTGTYPFQKETNLPHYIFIATKDQEQYTKNGPPYKHKRTAASDFVDELKSTLGDDIQIPFDLQRVPTNKPNFYMYLVRDEHYYLAVHLHQNFPFANKIGNYYYKVEISSNKNAGSKGTWLRNKLLAHPPFNAARKATPHKPDYAKSTREKLGGNDAFYK